MQQIALTVAPPDTETCTFPMSSFVDGRDLITALDQVRELGMAGKATIVFWNDFDCPLNGVHLGWLTYLIPPIRYGSYQDGRAIHQLGKSIFVFVGGTTQTLEGFRGCHQELFAAVRGPEFMSLLRGYLEVLGANPPPASGQPAADTHDPYYVVRRAVWLRHLLSRRAPSICTDTNAGVIVNIDPDVVHGFLYTPDYNHGLRSMEALIGMSRLGGRNRFDRDLLPSKSQMDLHTNGEAFISLVRNILQPNDPGSRWICGWERKPGGVSGKGKSQRRRAEQQRGADAQKDARGSR